MAKEPTAAVAPINRSPNAFRQIKPNQFPGGRYRGIPWTSLKEKPAAPPKATAK